MAVIRWVAVLALLGALGFAFFTGNNAGDFKAWLTEEFPGSTIVATSSESGVYKITASDRQSASYAATGSGQGYSGPVQVAVIMDSSGLITSIRVMKHHEWPVWFDKLTDSDYTSKFVDKNAAQFESNAIDGITGATYSSRGLISAVDDGSRKLTKAVLGIDRTRAAPKLTVGSAEFAILIMWIIALAAMWWGKWQLRWVTRLAGMIIIGFGLTIPVTLAAIVGVVLGYISLTQDTVIIYIMLAGALGSVLILGRNVYCHWLCPFGAVQDVLSLSGFSWKAGEWKIDKPARIMKPWIVWTALMIALVGGSPAFGSYEPFGVAFTFKGTNYQWGLLAVVLLMGLLIPRFWCSYGCPVNLILEQVARVHGTFRNLLVKGKVAECERTPNDSSAKLS